VTSWITLRKISLVKSNKFLILTWSKLFQKQISKSNPDQKNCTYPAGYPILILSMLTSAAQACTKYGPRAACSRRKLFLRPTRAYSIVENLAKARLRIQWQNQTRRFGGQSNKGAPKNLHLFKYPSFSATIFRYHTKVITFSTPRKCLFLLVKLCDLSGNHHSIKSPFTIHSKSLKETPCVLCLFRGVLYSTKSTNFRKYIFSQWQNLFAGRSLETLV